MQSVVGSTKTKSTNDVDEDFFAALTRQLSRQVHMKAFFRELSFLKPLGLLMVAFKMWYFVKTNLSLFLEAEELRKSLWAKNVPAKVYVGTRCWHPFTEEAIEQLKHGAA
ncbi:ferrochelatase-2, chloroplastic-like [Senna tora]|uniref:Ferrochelatase-2, chloroplastic-like n=1 Tax=Senna tora TaxID=362788 RepID=A0A834WTE6_9FABA|nr:ferrochelatase-2, chloroplastic-like [Senna tora]